MKILLGLLLPFALNHAVGQLTTTNTPGITSMVFTIEGKDYPVLSCSLAKEKIVITENIGQKDSKKSSQIGYDRDQNIDLRLSYRSAAGEIFHLWHEAILKADANAKSAQKNGVLIVRQQDGTKVMLTQVDLIGITLVKFSEESSGGAGNDLPVMNLTIHARELHYEHK